MYSNYTIVSKWSVERTERIIWPNPKYCPDTYMPVLKKKVARYLRQAAGLRLEILTKQLYNTKQRVAKKSIAMIYGLFWCFADRASQYNLSQWPTWCTKVFNIFITIVYMFRAISFIFFRFCFYQCIYGFIPV